MSNIVDSKLRNKEYSKKLNNVIIDKSYGESIVEEILDKVEIDDEINV